MLDRAEKQMDLLILGQTLTSDVSKHGGSRALGEVHADVRAEVIQAAANFAAGVLNAQLVRSILLLNYGEDSEAPEFRQRRRRSRTAWPTRNETRPCWRPGCPCPGPGSISVMGFPCRKRARRRWARGREDGGRNPKNHE